MSHRDHAACGLRGVVAEAAETVAPLASGPVRIENDVPDELDVMADPEQMFRIMLNSLRNGVEALERAGASPGRLPFVQVTARRDGMTVIDIIDTGPGIPLAMRPRSSRHFRTLRGPGAPDLASRSSQTSSELTVERSRSSTTAKTSVPISEFS